MSCNYAEGLSAYEYKGKLGVREVFDEDEAINQKASKLAEWIKEAKHVVVHTGAGISTAAGIPDFRGPNGVWTLEEKGLKPEVNISFDQAHPTVTHMGLSALINSGHITYVISQNIDGLHLKSGLKRENISELHGNMFVAQCNYCDRQFVQPRSVPTVAKKEIGANCPWVKAGGRVCRGKLRDNILDWEDNLPDRDLDMAVMHSTLADLSICLGTTMQIVPAGNLPLRAQKNGGKLVVINLQPTKHHKKADLVIHSQVDKVISKVAAILKVSIPSYSTEIDPTQNLLFSLRANDTHKILDWSISVSSVKKLNKVMAEHKSKRQASKTQKVSLKRKKTNQDDSNKSSDEDSKVSRIDGSNENLIKLENNPS